MLALYSCKLYLSIVSKIRSLVVMCIICVYIIYTYVQLDTTLHMKTWNHAILCNVDWIGENIILCEVNQSEDKVLDNFTPMKSFESNKRKDNVKQLTNTWPKIIMLIAKPWWRLKGNNDQTKDEATWRQWWRIVGNLMMASCDN